ncbi:hypothetical protein Tco_1144251 [Tanacetum coccineum]
MDSQRFDLLMGDRMTLQETVWDGGGEDLFPRTDRRHQAQMVETLHVMRDMRREMADLETGVARLPEDMRRVIVQIRTLEVPKAVYNDLGSTQEKDDGQVSNNTPIKKAVCSQGLLIWGQAKRSDGRILCQGAPSVFLHHNGPMHPEVATRVTRTFHRGIILKLTNKDGRDWRMHKAGFMQLGNASREGMHQLEEEYEEDPELEEEDEDNEYESFDYDDFHLAFSGEKSPKYVC